VENLHPVGLLHPLPIPTHTWAAVSMDFIEGLPISQGNNVIMVVIDRLSKYAHFIPLAHPYTTRSIAKLFLDNIFNGLPTSIFSNRDRVFTSNFWRELFRISGTDLLMNSTYLPQTDGQSEVMNKGLEGYLQSFTGHMPKDWMQWLSLAEWAYNALKHSSTKLTPFEAVYGYPPLRLLPYEPGYTHVQAMDDNLMSRDFMLTLIKENLKDAK
jgi:hypothetical protein